MKIAGKWLERKQDLTIGAEHALQTTICKGLASRVSCSEVLYPILSETVLANVLKEVIYGTPMRSAQSHTPTMLVISQRHGMTCTTQFATDFACNAPKYNCMLCTHAVCGVYP